MLDTTHHARSLDALTGDGERGLLLALERTDALSNRYLDVSGLRLTLGERHWRDRRERPTWVQELLLTGDLELRRPEAPVQAVFDVTWSLAYVPWLCDSDAFNLARPDITIPAGHDGLFLNGPMVPVAQMRLAPGLHYVSRDGRSACIIVPDVGPRFMVLRTGRGEPAVRVEGYGQVVNPSFLDRGQPVGSARAQELAAALFGVSARKGPFLLLDSTAAMIAAEAGGDSPALGLETLARILATLADDTFEPPPETDLERTEVRCYGDMVRAALVRAAYAARRRIEQRALNPRTDLRSGALFVPLVAAADRQLLHLAGRGRGGRDDPALVIADDRTNTLAKVERRRQLTRFGSGAIRRPYRGRAAIRDTHPSYRGRVCPLQTPESMDIGLVRFLAFGSCVAQGKIEPGKQWWSAAVSLIPFVQHDDPSRALIAAKSMRQALPIVGARPPIVATGTEREIAEVGVLRAEAAGTVVSVDPLTVSSPRGTQQLWVTPDATEDAGVDGRWLLAVRQGQMVTAGQVLAHAPDVHYGGVARAAVAGKVVAIDPVALEVFGDTEPLCMSLPDPGGATWDLVVAPGDVLRAGDVLATLFPAPEPELALGRDCLVAYTVWKGFNFEDGIVVSEAIVESFSSAHVVSVTDPIASDEDFTTLVQPGDRVEKGDAVALISSSGASRELSAPENGTFLRAEVTGPQEPLHAWFRVERCLRVGDKLTNRHGGKGVVSAILPVDRMPRLPDGRPVEMIINPIGIARRLNIGQLLEAHAGLVAQASGESRVVVPRHMEAAGWTALRRALSSVLDGGVADLEVANSERLTDVLVGTQYMMKLNHLAGSKLQARRHGARSPLTQQPAQGSGWAGDVKVGGAQRMGEMELWCLQSLQLDQVLADALTSRTVRKGQSPLRSVVAHLQAAGVSTHALMVDGTRLDLSAAEVTDVKAVVSLEHAFPACADDLADVTDALARLAKRSVAQIEGAGSPAGVGGALEVPVVDASCHCGVEERRGARCDVCKGVARRRPSPAAYAFRHKVVLPEPLPHPWLRREIEDLSETIEWPAGELDDLQEVEGDHAFDRVVEVPRVAARRRLHRELLAKGVARVTDELGSASSSAIQQLCILELPLLPAAFNPSSRRSGAPAYQRLAATARRLARVVSDTTLNGSDASTRAAAARRELHDELEHLLGSIDDEPKHNTIAGRLSAKDGLLWRALLGRRVDRSARAVLVPDPNLSPETVAVPDEVWRAWGLDRLIEEDPDHGDVVVLNRQPSLHPYSLVALRAQRTMDAAIKINPIICKAIAGDFDGDEVTLHSPDTAEARRQAWERLRPASNLRSAASGQVLAHLGQDVALGLFVAAERRGGWAQVATAVGIDSWTPPTGPVGEIIDDLAQHVIDTADAPVDALEVLVALQRLGFDNATGWSFSPARLDQLEASIVDEALASGGQRAVEDLAMEATLAAPGLGVAVAAGAAGKQESIAQLLAHRGRVDRLDPALATERSLAGCYLAGLAEDDYFEDTAKALASLGAKKLMSPHAGALTKMLAEIAYDVSVSCADCLALELDPTQRRIAETGVGGTRSPLTCAARGPCAACYGCAPGSTRPGRVGDRVGLLAAQLIGERSTQLTMRVHHGGGSGHKVDDDIPNLRALFGDGVMTFEVGELSATSTGLVTSLADLARARGSVERLVSTGLATVLLSRFDRVMKNAVAPVHAAVILRRLCDVAWSSERGSLIDLAADPGVALLAATRSGRLRPIVSAALGGGPEGGVAERAKAVLVFGSAHGD